MTHDTSQHDVPVAEGTEHHRSWRWLLRAGSRPDLGIVVYGAATIALGIIGLVWGDFASPWQPGLRNLPHELAYAASVCQLAGGCAVMWKRSANVGLYTLILLNLVFAVSWLIFLAPHLQDLGLWLNLAEQLAVLLGPVIAFACGPARPTSLGHRIRRGGRVLFGLCAMVFGVSHFFFLEHTAKMAPQWLPPGPQFWALATGLGHLLAGVAIVTGIQALLASRLLTAMILSFGALVWAPRLLADPTTHLFWSGNAINLALAGATWTLADMIASQRRPESAAPVARAVLAHR
jgi:uncharacterized membrane protein YphA (DoxX/SURF4 family)